MNERGTNVTIGVPVFHGENFLVETIDSIVAQTHRDWQVVFSIDGPDPACEQLCRRYTSDPRFRVHVQTERLGWVRNIAWLQDQATLGEFWCYLQQDDIIDPTYLEVLVESARARPDAAVVYCDMATFGGRAIRFVGPSVVGNPVERQLSLLRAHFAGVAFRGVTRVDALRNTGGGLVENDAHNFAAETVWISTMATWGELIRVPNTLYHKRYHDRQVHSEWLTWDGAERRHAWTVHCHDVLDVAMRVPAEPSRRWPLWLATLERLTASKATSYLPWAEFTDLDRVTMIDGLVDRIRQLGRVDLQSLLTVGWADIRERSIAFANDERHTAPSAVSPRTSRR